MCSIRSLPHDLIVRSKGIIKGARCRDLRILYSLEHSRALEKIAATHRLDHEVQWYLKR